MKWELYIILIISVFLLVSEVGAEPQILNYFPSCEYKIIDSITLKQSLKKNKQSSAEGQLRESTAMLLNRIKKKATENNAVGILLVDKKIVVPSQRTSLSLTKESSAAEGYILFKAELISGCDGNYQFENKRTKYNSYGDPQRVIAMKTELEQFTLVLPPISRVKKTMIKPEVSSLNVSFLEGTFGIRVHMLKDEVIETIGSPTSEFQTTANQSVFSYGRNLWVVFENNRVIKVLSRNQWLSNSLVNLLAFDDRITNKWKIMGIIEKGMSRDLLLDTGLGKFVEKHLYVISDASGASIQIRLGLVIDGDKTGWEVESFSYGLLEQMHLYDEKTLLRDTTNLYDVIYNIIQDMSEHGKAYRALKIDAVPIFRAVDNNGNIVKAYDNSLSIVFDNNELSSLSISESLFLYGSAKREWAFGPFYFNQHEDELREIYGEEIFELGDYWEMFIGDSKYALFFSETENGKHLSEIEIELF